MNEDTMSECMVISQIRKGGKEEWEKNKVIAAMMESSDKRLQDTFVRKSFVIFIWENVKGVESEKPA